ncbi:hypothetical protein K0U00_31705, partial [Paenibacillus sepulcri]|nr:hypothetical protein [Paenibacillus sepulcri]
FDGTTHLLATSATQVNGAGQWQYTQYTRSAQGTVTKVQVFSGTSTGQSGSALQETDYENIDPTTGNVGQIRTKNNSSYGDMVTAVQYSTDYQQGFPTATSTTIHDVDGVASTLSGSYAYDPSNGTLLRALDGRGNLTTYTYDALGRVTKALHQSDGSAATVTYNDYLNQLTTTDETGVSTMIRYNSLGWKTDEGILEDGTYKAKAKYGYDTNGRIKWTEDALGNRTTFGYDQWSRQSTVAYADDPTSLKPAISIYDDIEASLTTIDPEGYKLKEYYDKLGRTVRKEETKKDKPTQTLAQYTYDNIGNMLTTTDGLTPAHTSTYAYDALGQLGSVSSTVNGTVQVTSYRYDMMGNLTQILFPDNKTTVKKYDEAGRLIQNTEAAVSGKNNVENYYYDNNGNQTKLVDRNGTRFKYTFDGRNFLQKKEIVDAGWNPIPGEEAISFTYDLAGRRLSMTDITGTTDYGYNPSTGAGTSVTFPDDKVMTYDYNANGNRAMMKDPFGANTYYHYDVRNRLDTVGPSNNFVNDYEAKYQYFNNDLLKQITQRNGVTSVYSYDGMQVGGLTQKKADGSVLNNTSYTYDTNGNELTRTENSGTPDSFTYDELNRLSTSTQFNETYTYDSRGNRQSLTTSQPFDR